MAANWRPFQGRHWRVLAGCSLWPRRRPPMSPHDPKLPMTSVRIPTVHARIARINSLRNRNGDEVRVIGALILGARLRNVDVRAAAPQLPFVLHCGTDEAL